MNLEEKVKQTDGTISMHAALFKQRKHQRDVVLQFSFLQYAERTLCISPEIECTSLGTFGSERENSGFSV